jgi:hypothetical protein
MIHSSSSFFLISSIIVTCIIIAFCLILFATKQVQYVLQWYFLLLYFLRIQYYCYYHCILFDSVCNNLLCLERVYRRDLITLSWRSRN